MLVKSIMNAYEVKEEFRKLDRDYYSLTACQKLVDLFEDYCEPVEFDAIGICCDFNEEDWKDIKENYSNHEDIKNAKNIDELLDALNYYTIAYETEDGCILYQVW